MSSRELPAMITERVGYDGKREVANPKRTQDHTVSLDLGLLALRRATQQIDVELKCSKGRDAKMCSV